MIEHVMPLCLTISWVYTVAMLVQSIVYEKEQRLKEVCVVRDTRGNFLVDFVMLKCCCVKRSIKGKGKGITLYSATSGNCSWSSAVRHRLRRTCSLQAVG